MARGSIQQRVEVGAPRRHLADHPDQADGLALLLDLARKAKTAADAARKAEAKPFDDGKAEVQARYNPLLKTADTIADTLKAALGGWLQKLEAEKQEIAAQARADADKAAEIARKSFAATDPTNLAQRENAEAAADAADKARIAATRAENDRAQAKGGARAVSLRTWWEAVLNEDEAHLALAHFKRTRPEELKAWLREQGQRDVAAGARVLPGFLIRERQRVV